MHRSDSPNVDKALGIFCCDKFVDVGDHWVTKYYLSRVAVGSKLPGASVKLGRSELAQPGL